jgi:predicted transposase/invertase (TIGR01784 family)
LFFDSLDEKEMQVLKHWIENSVEDRLANEAVKILSSSKEEVEGMVASNAFIITEMEKKAEEKGIEKGTEKTIKELILKQYSKGLSIEYIAEINDLDLKYVQNVVSKNNMQ